MCKWINDHDVDVGVDDDGQIKYVLAINYQFALEQHKESFHV